MYRSSSISAIFNSMLIIQILITTTCARLEKLWNALLSSCVLTVLHQGIVRQIDVLPSSTRSY